MLWCIYGIVKVKETIFVPDVYAELLRYEREGLIKVSRFNDASEEVQAERVEKTVKGIEMSNLLHADSEKARLMKRYFKQTWELAKLRENQIK